MTLGLYVNDIFLWRRPKDLSSCNDVYVFRYLQVFPSQRYVFSHCKLSRSLSEWKCENRFMSEKFYLYRVVPKFRVQILGLLVQKLTFDVPYLGPALKKELKNGLVVSNSDT